MSQFFTKRTHASQSFLFPENGETVYETPPTLIWVPLDAKANYTAKIYNEEHKLVCKLTTPLNYATPPSPLPAGKYTWSIEADNGIKGDELSFAISKDAITYIRPTAKEVYSSIPDIRPRHLFFADDIKHLIESRPNEFATLKNNVELAYKSAPFQPPMYHRTNEALPYREYFNLYRDMCDRDLVALSLWYALTGDIKAGEKAKELFLDICDLNPYGPSNVMSKYGDEVGLSNARCLPSVFDLIYNLLDEKQLHLAACTIAAYAKQCKERIEKINYAQNPSDSHVGRLPCYLGEAALSLKGTGVESDETLISWLDTALDIYGSIFPYYGGSDGSWAEGTFYATSYTKWFLPFFSAVERYCNKSLMNRPFYHRYTNFLIHFCNPSHEIYPFGDGYWLNSDSDEFPGFFAQNPYRIYADKFGPELAKKYSQKLSNQEFFNLHLLDLFLPAIKVENSLAKDPENVEIFPDGGFAAMHTDLKSKDDICVLARASRFGSDSHRHADQGSFALFCGGVCLVSPSGYFGRRYGTLHHREWTNTTKAHNALLFNSCGQDTFSMKSEGKIVSVDKAAKTLLLDMSKAYDNITLWQRKIALTDSGIEICDTVKTDNDVEVMYPLHFLSLPKAFGNNLVVERRGKKLTITPMDEVLVLDSITDSADVELNAGEPEQYAVSMPSQYHAYYKSKPAKSHVFKVRFDIEY